MKTSTIPVMAAALLAAGSASAAPASYYASLTGAAEATPNDSHGIGSSVVTFDLTAHVLTVDLSFVGLEGLSTASHIHCCTTTPGTGAAIVATETPTFTSFPTGVTGGIYSMMYNTLLPGSWNPAFIAANGGSVASAEAAFSAGLATGSAYLNIHSTEYPAGEIRGFLAPVPEPGQWGMLLMGLPVLLALARRRH
ncbi:hypothetical protein GCM10027277_37000 [Pseudoduganella ginsengisoli]|uniref:CHRD domain-containing protein n=1 Tax=Pseudoduganella ginsengisoli TaxID=1462440 RepID=A0A6L6PY01_9BURK|nr:CHRD domain-containing protein [Pseudoduganella ginsengisoli]MTW02320.1 CHRD domain-containing protein [Pseudoduganella ginsengisoli]